MNILELQPFKWIAVRLLARRYMRLFREEPESPELLEVALNVGKLKEYYAIKHKLTEVKTKEGEE